MSPFHNRSNKDQGRADSAGRDKVKVKAAAGENFRAASNALDRKAEVRAWTKADGKAGDNEAPVAAEVAGPETL